MKNKQILFTAIHTAELVENEILEIKQNEVLTEMEYTVISGGTERANIMGSPNAGGNSFPKALGYCGVGRVIKIGASVKSVATVDRVLVYHGHHDKYNIRGEVEITKLKTTLFPRLTRHSLSLPQWVSAV